MSLVTNQSVFTQNVGPSSIKMTPTERKGNLSRVVALSVWHMIFPLTKPTTSSDVQELFPCFLSLAMPLQIKSNQQNFSVP